MGTPTGLPDPYVALAGELGQLGRRLDEARARLIALREVVPPPAAPHASYPGAHQPPWHTGVPMYGYAAAQPPAAPPVTPAAAAVPQVRKRPAPLAMSGARLLAWTGGGVTLLGVALLLALAASRGWLTPPARIAGGTLLGIALVGLGWRLHRKESARTGALAVAATGFATLYLVVAAATAVYGYIEPLPAIVVALLVAGAGLGVADRWRSQLLACGVTVGAALLAPALAHDWLLVALVLALQVAALPVVLHRLWNVLMLVAAAGPVLYGGYVIASGTDRPTTVALAISVLAVGLATAVPASRRLPAQPVAALVAAAPLPALVAAPVIGGWDGGGLAAGVALALAALAAVPGTSRTIRLVAAAAAAVALFEGTAVALDGSAFTLVVLGQSIVAAVLAAVERSRFALVAGLVYGGIGTLVAIVRDAPLRGLVAFPSWPYLEPSRTSALVTGAAVAAMVLGFAVATLVAAGRLGRIRPDARTAALWVPLGLTGLYGAAGLVITLALLVSPDRAGFTAGHALVTVSWTVAALVLLARGISRSALRITGLVLVAAAVAKLVLFDLVALDGLARVAAFLGAGLVLLAAGTRYARLVVEAERSQA